MKKCEPVGYCLYCHCEVVNIDNKIICPNCGDVVAKGRKYMLWPKQSLIDKIFDKIF